MKVFEYRNQLITVSNAPDGSVIVKTQINGVEPLSLRYYFYSKKEALELFKAAVDTELSFYRFFNS